MYSKTKFGTWDNWFTTKMGFTQLLKVKKKEKDREKERGGVFGLFGSGIWTKVSTSIPTKSTAHLTCQSAQVNGHVCYSISGTNITPNSWLRHWPLTWEPGSTTSASATAMATATATKTAFFGTRRCLESSLLMDCPWSHDLHLVWH